ncbi:regulatory protein YcgZ [Phytobacter sp. AG2a]
MRTSLSGKGSADTLSTWFSKATLPSQQETLGRIVVDILHSGNGLSRQLIYAKLLTQFHKAESDEAKQHFQTLLNLMIKPVDNA